MRHEMENRHQVRNTKGDLTLRLSMQGSTLGFVIKAMFIFWFDFLCFPKLLFSPHLYVEGEFANCHQTVCYLRRLCYVVIALQLSLAGSVSRGF